MSEIYGDRTEWDTDLPISDRTDESSVRTIAERLFGWKQAHFKNKDKEPINYQFTRTTDNGTEFHEIFNPLKHPDDRERVMLASGVFWQHIEKGGFHIWSWYDMTDQTAGQGRHKDSGRAFIEAVVMWIEAQRQHTEVSDE